MKPTALTFCFALVAPLCSVCQEGAAQTPPCNIDQLVVELAPDFNAVTYGDCDDSRNSCNSPPQPAQSGTVPAMPPTAVSDIQAAFNIAPFFFQQELCGLDYIFIDTISKSTNPIVWGLRGRLHNSRHNKNLAAEHIGISAQVWTTVIGQSGPYVAYENWVLNALLTPPPAANLWMSQLTYKAAPDPASPSTPNAIAILGILAHEMGHIIWWDRAVRDTACQVQGPLAYFYQYSWGKRQSAHGFHRFGRQDSGNRTIDRPDNEDVVSDLRSEDYAYPAAVNYLETIYGGEWASLFATVSLDEDFVETYKLWVLTDINNKQPLTQLQIIIPTATKIPDIIANLNNSSSKLYAKTQWIKTCYSWP
jgi:hypothetical protein